MRRSALLAGLVLLGSVGGVAGQTTPIGDPWEEYARLLQRGPTDSVSPGRKPAGSFMVRPQRSGWFSEDAGEGGAHPWLEASRSLRGDDASSGGPSLELTGARIRAFVNSGYPSGRNDGEVWAGKGVTTAFDAGVHARAGRFVIQVEPTVSFSQNAAFDLAPLAIAPDRPAFGYPWSQRIDLPQRFGPDAFWSFDLGQSFAAVELGGFEVGVGTRSMWWGPGVESALLMSDNAGGFPHGFAGTRRPVSIGIGTLEASWVWGRLSASGWSTDPPSERSRFFTGAAIAYSPKWVDGLSVGASRVFQRYIPDTGLDLSEYLLVLQGVQKVGFATPDNPTGEDEHDQLGSLFARWVFPESGLELYFEWARNDHSWDFRDLILEPEHSQAYTLGLQKAFALSGNRLLNLRGELTHLEQAMTFRARSNGSYYLHHLVEEGYTHEGQLLGAAVGPGGKSQYVGADLYAPWGKGSVYFRREVLNNDTYYSLIAPTGGFCCHDVPLTLGAEAMRFAGAFELSAGAAITRRLNRYYVEKDDVWNVNLSLSARWRPR